MTNVTLGFVTLLVILLFPGFMVLTEGNEPRPLAVTALLLVGILLGATFEHVRWS